jgi:hypothetical protein
MFHMKGFNGIALLPLAILLAIVSISSCSGEQARASSTDATSEQRCEPKIREKPFEEMFCSSALRPEPYVLLRFSTFC